MNQKVNFIIIGAAIIDVLARPVDEQVFSIGSAPADTITMSTGGDAINEATVLSALGSPVRLVSKIGTDSAGDYVLRHCQRQGIDTACVTRAKGLDTGMNIVLVDQAGERHFITAANGSLRKLLPCDISDEALSGGNYLCFASIFVAPAFDHLALTKLFTRAKAKGLILCADMTKCKHGETLLDMKDCLGLLDYIFPNYEEASLLTGLTDWDEIADAFLNCGVGHVVLKAGSKGCFIKTKTERHWICAFPSASCLDTTGAGDTFTACFLHALGQGMPLRDCGTFACAGASLCIEQVGATGAIQNIDMVMERFGSMLLLREPL